MSIPTKEELGQMVRDMVDDLTKERDELRQQVQVLEKALELACNELVCDFCSGSLSICEEKQKTCSQMFLDQAKNKLKGEG